MEKEIQHIKVINWMCVFKPIIIIKKKFEENER